MSNDREFLWVEKYRPTSIDDVVISQSIKERFQAFIDNGNIPNLLLSGSAGVGKTTVARAILEQLGCDYMIINGSLSGNIDTLRTDIKNFASTMSLEGGRKYVILDEADYLNPNSTQPALRNFMEEFSSNCGFILTCNFANRIIDPLQSRCSRIDFTFESKEKPKLASLFFKRTLHVLDSEGIEYDEKTVAELINKYFPDFRKVLNELQQYSVVGKIDTGILSNSGVGNFKQLVGLLKDKNFGDTRKWLVENLDNDTNHILRVLYDQLQDQLVASSIPILVLILAKYQYQGSFVADQEINMMACLTEIMADVEFK